MAGIVAAVSRYLLYLIYISQCEMFGAFYKPSCVHCNVNALRGSQDCNRSCYL